MWQRPQHLMMRAHRDRRVFYVEEPFHDARDPHLKVYDDPALPTVVAAHLPEGMRPDEEHAALRSLLDELYAERRIDDFVLWQYSSWAVPITGHLEPLVTVYDCMDDI
ncbi:MAG: glycosyltransferase family 1 protein, partial [Actinomycetota bacterium]|nr:glycosyltransferase family 1 protein [Actinomycetota bacterium]